MGMSDKKFMYRVQTRFCFPKSIEISKKQVVRTTDKQVIYLMGRKGIDGGGFVERREKKDSLDVTWFETLDDAKDFVDKWLEKNIKKHENKLEAFRSDREYVSSLTDKEMIVDYD